MVGTGKAAEYGILIKSAESLENLHSVDTVVLDKTGTITSGHPSVTDVMPLTDSLSEAELLQEAAAVELGSEHPLAQAVVEKAKAEGLCIPSAETFEAQAGRGVPGAGRRTGVPCRERRLYEGKRIGCRRPDRRGAGHLAKEGKTPLLFSRDGAVRGIIAVADTVRDSSREAIRRFHRWGLRVVMLTGR